MQSCRRGKCIFLLTPILIFVASAFADPPPSSVVLANPKKDVVKTKMAMMVNKKKLGILACAHMGKSWLGGMNAKTYFYPLAGLITDKQNQLDALKAFDASGQGTADTAKQISGLTSMIKGLKGLVKPAKKACTLAVKAMKAKSGSSSSGSSSGGSSTGSGGTNYFDGDCLTSFGRSALGIPSSISSACKSPGQSYSNANACTSCHTEKGGRNFSQAMAGYSLPTMSALPHSNQAVADLVAWLNRAKN